MFFEDKTDRRNHAGDLLTDGCHNRVKQPPLDTGLLLLRATLLDSVKKQCTWHTPAMYTVITVFFAIPLTGLPPKEFLFPVKSVFLPDYSRNVISPVLSSMPSTIARDSTRIPFERTISPPG